MVKSGQTMAKLWSNYGQTNYSRILVLINNYFSFLNFGQIWSNYGQTVVKSGQTMVKSGQTVVKLIIQEILVLLIF